MILGYQLSDYQEYGLKVPVSITLAKQTSSILIAGKSGSGKSLSARWYLWQLLSSGESAVYISDYKAGEEYEAFEGSPAYASGQDAIQMILDFYDFFTEIRRRRIRLKKHYTLFIEEYFGLLTYAETQSKKLKTEIMSKVGEILAVSRALNTGLMVCVQRADAANFASGSREQFQAVLSFGRCSAEQFRMLGFSGELEENPTGSYKAGQALALIDGQESVQEIIVPLIRNPDVMCRDLRFYLSHQPDFRPPDGADAVRQ
ncbi:hypothetical protein [uncultured Merdimonas sp.]|uniref:hypothetical protein n=1 Tax=uncultured Merdimonas sp. TaxID=2023269 RepID=UPI003209D0BA